MGTHASPPEAEALTPRVEPPHDCPLCARLHAFRHANREKYPDYYNAPVPGFGPRDARLLIVGLAPGLHGANRTGRPFTGDWAGDLLFATLKRHGLARGDYQERADDGLELVDCRISNSVRCVPPENKPLPAEVNTCRQFLIADMEATPTVRCILTLGQIAHESALKALALKRSAYSFGHGRRYDLEKVTLIASYHCSRYNTNTGVLTEQMFDDVIAQAKAAAMH